MGEALGTRGPTPGDIDALRVLAVDDEPPALGELVYLLEGTPGISTVLPAGSAADALALLQAGGIDAVFLDIRMPGIDGLALAGILARFAVPPPVVFVTAYDTHAVQAFDLAAVDYLLKPIRAERLAEAVQRVQRHLETVRAPEPAASAPPAAPPAAPAPAPDETIAVELGGVTRYVRRSEVVYVEAQRDYVRLCTRTSGHLVRIPLAALEERWAPVGFLRVHRRYLVNSGYVEGLRTSAGMVSVDLGHDQHVPVSRRFTSAVRAALVQRHRLDREPSHGGPRRTDPGNTPDPTPPGSAAPPAPAGPDGTAP
jgi:DNA-binding LytR/AlgR family response regulator